MAAPACRSGSKRKLYNFMFTQPGKGLKLSSVQCESEEHTSKLGEKCMHADDLPNGMGFWRKRCVESGDVCSRVDGVGFKMQSRQISFYSKGSDYIRKKREWKRILSVLFDRLITETRI